ncbi:MAG: hypothetical protein B7Z15_09225 [Rhizobiales bacterium 32-66-8]|nr:MAG: hypothetical protein B7Z15_09225 [Rhizobiales bacterium 32-66-8]
MSAPALPPEDFDRLAAEHVLGLLEPVDAAQAERLLAEEPAFRQAVEDWRLRFAELDATALPAEAPDSLLARISASLDATPAAPVAARTLAQATADAIGGPGLAAGGEAPGSAWRGGGALPSGPDLGRGTDGTSVPPPPLIPHPAGAFSALWRSLGFWRGAGIGGVTAALVLALAVVIGPLGRGPTATYVAVLMGPQGEPAAVVNAFADGTAELIPLRTIAVPDGRVLEVWTLWDPARGPVSLGLTSEARRIPLDLKALPRTAPNQLFEITLEPQGGSPTGRPTGPILMKGTTSLAL